MALRWSPWVTVSHNWVHTVGPRMSGSPGSNPQVSAGPRVVPMGVWGTHGCSLRVRGAPTEVGPHIIIPACVTRGTTSLLPFRIPEDSPRVVSRGPTQNHGSNPECKKNKPGLYIQYIHPPPQHLQYNNVQNNYYPDMDNRLIAHY
ncbi:hypothetical protein FKM82_018479 [Ascaphus truei]